MLEAFIITFWLEYDGGELRSYELTPTRECEQTAKKLYDKFKDRPEKLIAVKCDTSKTYREKKEYFQRQ
tara:strand:- start:12166 stop:12372 length:207 start_codon:yes stop_codon:yes gene_type:complete